MTKPTRAFCGSPEADGRGLNPAPPNICSHCMEDLQNAPITDENDEPFAPWPGWAPALSAEAPRKSLECYGRAESQSARPVSSTRKVTPSNRMSPCHG